MIKPKISVIIPVYNVEKYLQQCLESVINQTFKNVEIICINDGSIDNSLGILKEYSQKDEKIKIINQTNQGLSGARNSAIEVASGKYIYFLDSDDYINNTFLEEMYSVIEKANADLVYCKAIKTYDNKLKNEEYTFSQHGKELKYWFASAVWFYMFKRDLLNSPYLFRFQDGIIGEDNLFSFQLFRRIKTYAYADKAILYYRQHNKSIMAESKSRIKEKYVKDRIIIFKDLLELAERHPEWKEEYLYAFMQLFTMLYHDMHRNSIFSAISYLSLRKRLKTLFPLKSVPLHEKYFSKKDVNYLYKKIQFLHILREIRKKLITIRLNRHESKICLLGLNLIESKYEN